MTAKERYVWIRCQGAPVNVWGSDFFSTMGRSWGNFMCLDDSTSKKERFDVARFFISTPIMETISVSREIKINGSFYKLKFTEEEFTNCFFSLKHDFIPSFNSESEDRESWSTGTEPEMLDEEDVWRNEEVQFECPVEEDDDIRRRRKEEERSKLEQISKEAGVAAEIIGDNLDEFQISNARERSRRTGGGATGQTVQASSSEIGEKSGEDINHKLKPRDQPMARPTSRKESPRAMESTNVDGAQVETIKETPVAQQSRKERKKEEELTAKRGETSSNLHAEPGRKGCGDSVGDSDIHNVNRALKKQWQTQLAKEIWDLATQLGAVAENDNEVIQRIEEMEDRDQRAKRIMVNREEKGSRKVDWGPKPFRFFDSWLDQSGCKEVIVSVWSDSDVKGWNGFKLKEKLKRTKKALKEWSGKTNREMEGRIKEAELLIASIDKKGEQHQLSDIDIELRRNSFIELSIKGRWCRNEINSIRINGEQYTGVEVIKREVAKYFQELFTEENWRRPKLDGICFRQITKTDNELLTTIFSEQEIKEAIWNCDPSKSPRPDGFNFRFIMTMWEVVKDDIINFVREFHQHGKMVRGSNASFIVLIPKTENPQAIEEFRPISLIGVTYKIMAKLLANRLRKVLPKVIGEQQMAFIEGRQLVEGAVIANEILDKVKRKKKKGFLFKVDFEKAYDKVSWEFIDYMMMRMGFCATWRKWIQECLNSSSVSILINGSPTNQFSVNKGIRQGDPLSPFLFLIVAEGLNGLMSSAVDKERYKGVGIGSGDAMVTHLQFTDDTIFFGDATEDNIRVIKCIMRTFELASGLKINFGKSQLIGVGVDQNWSAKMAYQLCCKEGKLPFKYLGILIGRNHRRKAMWQPMVESVRKKLASWKGRYLSMGGRITVINSVLSSLPVFLMSVYVIPKGIIKDIGECKCGICGEEDEDTKHLFLRCNMVRWLWMACAKWWGIKVTLEEDCWNTFRNPEREQKEKCIRDGWDCI
ncbi:hypothetical protein SLEP1_g32439 [Rubroshorea leprosula]|uniref:Reverse transcriptase domain-containing protein n=1 Tax=Rubroshorea leprosula TaxID=152421 RepID=A0AAV5KDG9_9ROSI|nr:hypothetical protein SLEP1_g32439 [Rubroshorea leprosula]